jgi:DNA-directed RNA polymerase specialized sigma24 family protein
VSTDETQPESTGRPRSLAQRAGLRGDEAQLFAQYGVRLRRVTSLNVATTPANIDDACAFAWSELVARQPRRLTVFGWLRTVARREAIRLDEIDRRAVQLDVEKQPGLGRAAQPTTAAHRTIDSAHGMLEVRERLAILPHDQRGVAFMRAAGWRYTDIADCLDVTEARVGKLLRRADGRLRDLDQRDRTPASDRAARLQQLERDPPPFLLRVIGRPPRPNAKRGETLLLEWRRLALAIDDYRATHNITDPVRAFGADVLELGAQGDHVTLLQRISDYRLARRYDLVREL